MSKQGAAPKSAAPSPTFSAKNSPFWEEKVMAETNNDGPPGPPRPSDNTARLLSPSKWVAVGALKDTRHPWYGYSRQRRVTKDGNKKRVRYRMPPKTLQIEERRGTGTCGGLVATDSRHTAPLAVPKVAERGNLLRNHLHAENTRERRELAAKAEKYQHQLQLQNCRASASSSSSSASSFSSSSTSRRPLQVPAHSHTREDGADSSTFSSSAFSAKTPSGEKPPLWAIEDGLKSSAACAQLAAKTIPHAAPSAEGLVLPANVPTPTGNDIPDDVHCIELIEISQDIDLETHLLPPEFVAKLHKPHRSHKGLLKTLKWYRGSHSATQTFANVCNPSAHNQPESPWLCRSFSEIRNYFDRERDLLATAARTNSEESELSRADILFNEIFTYFKERAVLVWLLRRIRDAERGSVRKSGAAADNANANQWTIARARTLPKNDHAMRLLGEKVAERLEKQRAARVTMLEQRLDSEIGGRTGSTRSNHHNNAQVASAAESTPAAGAGVVQVKQQQEPDSTRVVDDRSKIKSEQERQRGDDASALLSSQAASSQHHSAASSGPDFDRSGKTGIKQEETSSESPVVGAARVFKADSPGSPDVQIKAEASPPEYVTRGRSIKREPELIATSSARERENCAHTRRIKYEPTLPGAAGRHRSRVICEPEYTSRCGPMRIKQELTSPTPPESPRFCVNENLIFHNTSEKAGTVRIKKEQQSPALLSHLPAASTNTQAESIGFLGRPLRRVKEESAAPVLVSRSANKATCETQQNGGGHLRGDEKSKKEQSGSSLPSCATAGKRERTPETEREDANSDRDASTFLPAKVIQGRKIMACRQLSNMAEPRARNSFAVADKAQEKQAEQRLTSCIQDTKHPPAKVLLQSESYPDVSGWYSLTHTVTQVGGEIYPMYESDLATGKPVFTLGATKTGRDDVAGVDLVQWGICGPLGTKTLEGSCNARAGSVSPADLVTMAWTWTIKFNEDDTVVADSYPCVVDVSFPTCLEISTFRLFDQANANGITPGQQGEEEIPLATADQELGMPMGLLSAFLQKQGACCRRFFEDAYQKRFHRAKPAVTTGASCCLCCAFFRSRSAKTEAHGYLHRACFGNSGKVPQGMHCHSFLDVEEVEAAENFLDAEYRRMQLQSGGVGGEREKQCCSIRSAEPMIGRNLSTNLQIYSNKLSVYQQYLARLEYEQHLVGERQSGVLLLADSSNTNDCSTTSSKGFPVPFKLEPAFLPGCGAGATFPPTLGALRRAFEKDLGKRYARSRECSSDSPPTSSADSGNDSSPSSKSDVAWSPSMPMPRPLPHATSNLRSRGTHIRPDMPGITYVPGWKYMKLFLLEKASSGDKLHDEHAQGGLVSYEDQDNVYVLKKKIFGSRKVPVPPKDPTEYDCWRVQFKHREVGKKTTRRMKRFFFVAPKFRKLRAEASAKGLPAPTRRDAKAAALEDAKLFRRLSLNVAGAIQPGIPRQATNKSNTGVLGVSQLSAKLKKKAERGAIRGNFARSNKTILQRYKVNMKAKQPKKSWTKQRRCLSRARKSGLIQLMSAWRKAKLARVDHPAAPIRFQRNLKKTTTDPLRKKVLAQGKTLFNFRKVAKKLLKPRRAAMATKKSELFVPSSSTRRKAEVAAGSVPHVRPAHQPTMDPREFRFVGPTSKLPKTRDMSKGFRRP
ncbi:unnamed protein product [Amoebophrya sp. A120]|nr:unnamed protein product [Amoebophrya sp. A120]|eukprot:GSA120T00018911001.1